VLPIGGDPVRGLALLAPLGFLRLDLSDRLGLRDDAQAWVERRDPLLRTSGGGGEVLVGAAERIARDRITAHADKQLELDL